MKNIIIIIILFISILNAKSQITTDYPFKTYLDSSENLYVTGNQFNPVTNTIDLLIEKYDSGGVQLWSEMFPGSAGVDRGLDLAVDSVGNVYVTGYIFNGAVNGNDIITLKYNSGGVLQWDSVINNPGDDKGMGIDIDVNTFTGRASAIYVSGFMENTLTSKDFLTVRYDEFGNEEWKQIYNNYSGADVATEIILDAGHAYVAGYSYQGPTRLNDIMILTYDKFGGFLTDVLIHDIPGKNETPTGFQLVNESMVPVAKSKSVLTGISDGYVMNHPNSKYLTIFYDVDVNNNVNMIWNKLYSNGPSKNNISTSVAVDNIGDVYVTGYVYNYDNMYSSNGLDFATIKYKKESGVSPWVKFYNHNPYSNSGADDKASSIKVNVRNEIFVTGPSDAASNGYSVVKYSQATNPPIEQWHTEFAPPFADRLAEPFNMWSILELGSDGNPLVIVMAWNDQTAYWSARKYDNNGLTVYTINPFAQDEFKQISKSNEEDDVVLQNYPNPFNPSTVIKYSVPETGKVKVIVYDMLGKEIRTVVNEIKPKGIYEEVFEGSGNSSGIYFYKLLINDIVIDTKRMILVK